MMRMIIALKQGLCNRLVGGIYWAGLIRTGIASPRRAGGLVLFKSWYWKEVEASKALLLSKWPPKLP